MDYLRGSGKIGIVVIATTLGASCLLSCHSPSQNINGDEPGVQAPGTVAKIPLLEGSLTVGTENYPYAVSIPPMWEPQRTWPIIVFLHGLGTGRGGKRHDGHGFRKMLRKATPPLPVVVVFPQCPLPHFWHEPAMQTMILQALKQTIQEFHGDEHRLYLVGHSLGGFGVWALAAAHPGIFAALVPIASSVRLPSEVPCLLDLCSSSSTTNPYLEVAQRIGRTSIWMFHGAKDPFVSVSEARQMFNTLRSLEANVRYTEYADRGHRCWKQAYAEPELLPWLLDQHQG